MYFRLAAGPLTAFAYKESNFSFYCFQVKRGVFLGVLVTPNIKVCCPMGMTESIAVIPILPVGIPPTVKARPHLLLGDAHINEFAFGNDDVELRQPRISQAGKLGRTLFGVKAQLEMLGTTYFHVRKSTTARAVADGSYLPRAFWSFHSLFTTHHSLLTNVPFSLTKSVSSVSPSAGYERIG